MGIIVDHCKDPHQTTSIINGIRKFFFFLRGSVGHAKTYLRESSPAFKSSKRKQSKNMELLLGHPKNLDLLGIDAWKQF